jgi:hypothetical protein
MCPELVQHRFMLHCGMNFIRPESPFIPWFRPGGAALA